MPKGNILIADDSRLSRSLCADILVEDGFQVETASNGEEALDLIKTGRFDLVILDLVLPDINGQEVLKRSRQINISTCFIIMTGNASIDSAIDCLKNGASDYLIKPIHADEFRLTVNRAVEHKKLFEENAGLKNLIKLYDVTKILSSCLDFEKFHEVVLDSLLQVVEGKVGLSVFSDREPSDWRLKAFRGTSEEDAEILTNILMPHLHLTVSDDKAEGTGQMITKTQVVSLKPDESTTLSAKAGEFLVVPVINTKIDSPVGYVAVFNETCAAFSETDMGNAAFISDQASLSLGNIELYNGARQLTYIDDLTKLYNIRYMDVILENEIRRAKRFNSQLSLLFIDIDFFKNINDTFGHRIGSRTLVELGQVLKDSVREVDTIIRYGGDEFTVILVETSPEGAMTIAERIRKAVERHVFLFEEGLSIRLTITIGVTTYPKPAKNMEELLTIADNAMYKGKKSTRNVVVLA